MVDFNAVYKTDFLACSPSKSSFLSLGKALVPSLISYSERGQAYVNDVLGMMRYNKLDATDHTYLMDMKPILLVPVGEGVK